VANAKVPAPMSPRGATTSRTKPAPKPTTESDVPADTSDSPAAAIRAGSVTPAVARPEVTSSTRCCPVNPSSPRVSVAASARPS
jgi:hypothetical protein